MPGPIFLGIDIGTGSSKAVACDLEGKILAQAIVHHRVSQPRHGYFEMDAEENWWGEAVQLCRQILSQVGRVDAVCLSGIGPCLLVADDQLRPLRPAILYGVDSRANEQIAALNQELGEEEIFRRCGKALSSQAIGPKMRWVRDNEPEVWRQARRWYNSNTYLVAKLTGEYVIDHQSASQCDPLYSPRIQQFTPDWAPLLQEHLEQPRLLWSDEKAGEVTAEAAEATGLGVGTPVICGTIDAWAEAFSAGVSRPGDLMLMYGSTMFMVELLGGYYAHPQLWTTSGIYPGELTLAAGMSSSGALTRWARDLFGGEAAGVTFAELSKAAADIPPGSDGLLVLPYFAGERTPIFDDKARGTIIGLTLSHTPAHIFRAIYEGIGYGIRQICDFYAEVGQPVNRIFAVGGGSQSAVWLQAVSDITGLEQLVPDETIGAAYGDALLAAIGSGHLPAGTIWAKPGRIVKPRAELRPLYDRLFDCYCQLYPATKQVMHTLADLQLE